MHQIMVLETASGKMAILRDICLCVGIQLNLNLSSQDSSVSLVLETDPKKLREVLSYKIQENN